MPNIAALIFVGALMFCVLSGIPVWTACYSTLKLYYFKFDRIHS